MRYHLGAGDYARLKFSEGVHSFALETLLVPSRYRKQGVGVILVERLVAMADAMGKDTLLTVRPIGQSSEEIISRLIQFYERFGFELTEREAGLAHMRRPLKSAGSETEPKQ